MADLVNPRLVRKASATDNPLAKDLECFQVQEMSLDMNCNWKNCVYQIGLSLFLSQVLSGQCPDRKERENLIHYIRDSSHVASARQIQTLLSYQSMLAACPPDSI